MMHTCTCTHTHTHRQRSTHKEVRITQSSNKNSPCPVRSEGRDNFSTFRAEDEMVYIRTTGHARYLAGLLHCTLRCDKLYMDHLK